MHRDVERLAEQSGGLRRITGAAVPGDRFTRLRLEFEAGVLELTCDDDTDEIVASVSGVGGHDPEVEAVALRDLIGLTIEHAWELRNHRGYMDAFQLRLRDGSGREATVQFEVGASAIDLRRVT